MRREVRNANSKASQKKIWIYFLLLHFEEDQAHHGENGKNRFLTHHRIILFHSIIFAQLF